MVVRVWRTIGGPTGGSHRGVKGRVNAQGIQPVGLLRRESGNLEAGGVRDTR